MKKSLVVILGLAFLTVPFSQAAFSQEDEVVAVAEEETDYSFGTVKSVTEKEIVVTEYDYESDKDVDIVYTADVDIKLENVDAVANIQAGDSVEIDFVTKDGKKIAKTISVEQLIEEEEEAEE
ncbi:MAG TPA: hypothetical protein VD913_06240 [bacterium]|nr:hypothetical protein [bacterium]